MENAMISGRLGSRMRLLVKLRASVCDGGIEVFCDCVKLGLGHGINENQGKDILTPTCNPFFCCCQVVVTQFSVPKSPRPAEMVQAQ